MSIATYAVFKTKLSRSVKFGGCFSAILTLAVGEIAGEVVSMSAAAAGVYLAVGPVLLAVKLPMEQPRHAPGDAHGVERAAVIVVSFVVAVTASDLGSQAAPMMTVVNDNGDAAAMWRARRVGGAANRRRGYKVAYPCLA